MVHKILQGRQEKLLLSEKGKRGDEFHLAVLSRMDSQGSFRTWLKTPAKPMERLRPPPEETGSVSDPPTEKWHSEKRNLEGDFSAAVFNFTLNNTETVLGFLQHLKLG